MENNQVDESGSSIPQVGVADTGERHSSHAPQDGATHELPLCPNRLIIAVEAVRGTGFALELLREQLRLRTSAKLVFSSYSGCYFLQVDDFDRYQNRCVGMLEAVSTLPFRSAEIFKNEIAGWKTSDITQVVDANGLKALAELGLVPPSAGKPALPA
ncbi:hypothetical protein BGP84_12890 [Pseudomonas putida]|uniref:Uncharacterized protein n=1 Tax=Pseudomonas putida TaxID=303 RepID=A0A2S3X4S2_PSEPU|nr:MULTISPECIES: hypothetical protein [Pseudomonas]PTC01453.1 hypothetical protein C9975_02065 [Thalassospira xiamenensis]ELF6204242.1 hypothetical protein [Pseudomonas putida]MBF8803208.1 hypothetical protein [Pseudomonas asiatica]MCE0968685.1 hypothetical protein [Pseudomonas sp. NMI4491_12]MDO1494529.1 hypothetical protein [Pseudomonas putida]